MSPVRPHIEDPRQNQLLAALPALEWNQVRAHLIPCEIGLGGMFEDERSGEAQAFFPTSAVVSLVQSVASGAWTQVATVGSEGMIGVNLLLGGGNSLGKAMAQKEGWGYSLVAGRLEEALDRGGSMRMLFLRFTQALLTQVAQTAVCNRLHSVDQQVCRWLLLSLDRLPSQDLTMTHKLLGALLGIRREGVTGAANRLQLLRIISYRHGQIKIVDRSALEARACECYGVVRREYQRLLPTQTGNGMHAHSHRFS